VAFTFANALEYLDRAVHSGLDADAIASRMSFFFAAHNDLFEEVAKFRAARRLWARLVKERYDGGEASCLLRFHTQTGGSTLTAQQPLNNVVRVAMQALSAVLGGTQSLHTNGYDEALALPTADAARLALRTQQVLAYESGVTGTVDPLGGSYFVEALTDTLEQRAAELLSQVQAQGGAAAAIARGFFQDQIHQSAYAHQQSLERGETVVVGVNRFADANGPPVIPAPDYSGLASAQRARLAQARRARDQGSWRQALESLAAAARGTTPLMPLIVDAVRARATVGEICDALRGVWGVYRPNQ
jgi:methylmalonyl-CoA mutase N-terminal domain/subunit